MCFQTPMLPWRMLCPAASSIKNSGTPTIIKRKTYSSMKAPGGKDGILQHMRHIQAIFFPCPMHLLTLHFLLWNTIFSVDCLFTSSQFPVRCSPPPFWWQRYGNLHTFPRPTLNPTWASTYWTLESHAGRSSSSSDVPAASEPWAAASWVSELPSPSQALSSKLSSGGFSS